MPSGVPTYLAAANLLALSIIYYQNAHPTPRECPPFDGPAREGTVGPTSTGSVATARVISFSLYNGDLERYGSGAKRNAELVAKIFPGWTMRVYHDRTTNSGLLGLLAQSGVELINMENSTLSPMIWRFTVASDPTVARYIIRDIDSRLMVRDARAVDEWWVAANACACTTVPRTSSPSQPLFISPVVCDATGWHRAKDFTSLETIR